MGGEWILHVRDRENQVSRFRILQKQVWGGFEPRQFIWEVIPGDASEGVKLGRGGKAAKSSA